MLIPHTGGRTLLSQTGRLTGEYSPMEKYITRAARLNGPYDIELIERELECGEDDIIVKTHLMGICGSDKNFYRGHMPPSSSEYRQPSEWPFLLGHESGGTVIAVGSHVTDYKIGDEVVSFAWNNCFADYFSAKSFQLQHTLPGLNVLTQSLGEPTACAMFSGLNCGVQLGDTVVIMGAGYAGQIIAQCAAKKGAYRVIVVDVLNAKLDLAASLGADVVINSAEEDPVAKVKALTDGIGADVVIECAGSADSFNAATALLRHNGKFVFYSWVTTPITLDISRWHDDGLEFINTCLDHHTWQERSIWFPRVMRPVAQETIQIRPLITNEFRLADIKEAFAFADHDDAAIKVILRP